MLNYDAIYAVANAMEEYYRGGLKYDDSSYRAASRIVEDINESKNYRIDWFRDKTKEGNSYGFVETVYVNGKYLHKDLRQYDDKLVIVRVSEGPKGLRANALEYFNPEGCRSLMREYADKFSELLDSSYHRYYDKYEEEKVRRERELEEANAKWRAEQAAKEAAIRALVGTYEIRNEYSRSSYGGSYKADFVFTNPINEETFKEFLSLNGHKVEAKPCFIPICPEVVTFYPLNGGMKWRYEWVGEWDD